MNLFHPDDQGMLVAPSEQFDRDALVAVHGAWGGQLLRNALALEVLCQITNAGEDVLVKGGTLLQSRLQWPPRRASVDLDLETKDPDSLRAAIDAIVKRFHGLRLTYQESPLPGFVAAIDFPGPGVPVTLRIDALAFDRRPSGSRPWTDIPEPWRGAAPTQAAPPETQAAQKLLMSAAPPYGRDLGVHLGRQNLVKDLYDLRCLADVDLDGAAITAAALEDVERKSAYLDTSFHLDEVASQARETLTALAHAPVNDDSLRGSIWRARERVRSGIREGFAPDEVRIAAGCAHHCIDRVIEGDLDWHDAWLPATQRQPRAAWSDAEQIRTVLEADDSFGDVRGVREAWALSAPC